MCTEIARCVKVNGAKPMGNPTKVGALQVHVTLAVGVA